jgi:hypothetical protein
MVPPSRTKPRKFCTDQHADVARRRTADTRKKIGHRALKEIMDVDGNLHPERARRGRVYELLKTRADWLDAYRSAVISDREIAALCETTTQELHQALAAITLDEITDRKAAHWRGPSSEAKAALEDFVSFRDRYFRTEENKQYVTEPFHIRWIEAILATMAPEAENRRLMILAPPRHGKTQLLLHFCTWLIVRNPHIRIAWIAGAKDLAEDWIASLEDELETNEKLKKDFLAPGQSFRPGKRSRRSWSRSQFTVDTRTLVVKSPTMIASSRGSKILSRDIDLLIADDIEDHGSTIQPAMREQTRHWFATDVGSRKEGHTAHIFIGSRQHPDDLAGHLIESDAWQTIIETAHSETCEISELEVAAHVECMLWPTRHNFRWLMEQLASFETTGGRALWEMVYLNRPTAEGMMMFEREPVLAARNFERGLFEYPEQSILVAGLDPSGTGHQASFLWAWNEAQKKVFMVDLDNGMGGGIARARGQVEAWYDGIPNHKLFCRTWFVEENLYKGGITEDEILGQYCLDRMIMLNPHQTGNNKWDPFFGVSVLAAWFAEGRIDLPYRGAAAQQKTDAFIRQLLYFSSAGASSRRRPTSDLVMASWFPFPHLQFLFAEQNAVTMSYAPGFKSWTQKPMFTYARK